MQCKVKARINVSTGSYAQATAHESINEMRIDFVFAYRIPFSFF